MSDQLDFLTEREDVVLIDHAGDQVVVPVEGLVLGPVVQPHTILAPRPGCNCSGCQAARRARAAPTRRR
jgi:hypothetical protein